MDEQDQQSQSELNSQQQQQHQQNNDIIFKWSSPPIMNTSSEACIKTMSHKAEMPIILSGWLYKMRRRRNQTLLFTPNWNKRWVVIQNDSLSWRHSKSSEVAGSIDLRHVESIHKVQCLKKKRSVPWNDKKEDVDRIFVIKSKKRALCLMTIGSHEGCDKWIRALELQLNLMNGGTFSGPRNEKNRRKSNGLGDKDKYDVS